MPMMIEHPETGEEMEVYTPDEIKQYEESVAAAQQEIENLKTVSAEKTENFKRYKEMTSEEKEALTANQIELLRRDEQLEQELSQLKEQLQAKETGELERNKKNILEKFHRGDEALKETLESNWNMLNVEGSDIDSLSKRAELAARMAGIEISNANPLRQTFSGEAPKAPSAENEAKMTEAEGLARKAMGLPTNE